MGMKCATKTVNSERRKLNATLILAIAAVDVVKGARIDVPGQSNRWLEVVATNDGLWSCHQALLWMESLG